MIDKLKFNNLIISNAKVIQKVRIQIVRKIIQRMRKLKTLLEKRPNDQSTIVKQRKCVAIVERVKKIKREDIIRNILLLDKNPSKIVTNSQSTPEEVAIALLAANKTMQELAQRFRQELSYNEAAAESWKKSLIEIGKQKAKKQRKKNRTELNEKQPKEKLPVENNGSMSKPSKKHTKQINDGKKVDIKEEAAMCKANQVVKPKLETTHNKAIKKTKAKPVDIANQSIKAAKTKNLKTHIKDDEESMTLMIEEDDIKPTKVDKSKTLETTQKTSKPKPEKKLKFLTGYGKMEDLPPSKAVEFTADTPMKPVQVGVVDPFFLTETGEHYIANIVLKPERSEYADDSSKPRKEFAKNPKKIRSDGMDNVRNPKKFKANSIEDKQNHEGLHPSWLAKKKQSSITGFSGKKITFDDGVAIETSAPHKNVKEATQSDLHPSWAAKQKLKPTITAFQGKKITFGDYE